MKRLSRTIWTLGLILTASALLGQGSQYGRQYAGPDDPPADPQFEREGKMTGNRVMILFKNNTELSDFPRKDASRWPNTYYGNIMQDGIGLLICARVFVRDDSIPVDTPEKIAQARADGARIDTLYFLQTNYREEMDRDPTGTVEWGLHPVYGYLNINSESPAMSNDPNSWPPQGWPATDHELKWQGQWDGRFGKGVMYADLECYFVANDAQDQEYLGDDDVVKYYPRPDVPRMVDVFPELSVQANAPWGGLGVRVQQRGFQWNNPQARDAIFFEYTIANTSAYNILEMAFGYWLDNDIGGENVGEDAAFDVREDLSYSWDWDGKGEGGYPTGNMGFAYLESPGIAWDRRDNDQDGIVDERRDNPAGSIVGPMYHISNLENFLQSYGLQQSELKDHFEGDEDQDWDDGIDANGNGRYDIGEFSGDDLGLDGVAPGELQYTGPDVGECNHRPDFAEGVGCEPDFGWVDISESDMLGLTSMQLFEAVPHTEPYARWFRNDPSMWTLLTRDTLQAGATKIQNLFETFATDTFPLYQGLTERISMAELHAYDDLSGMNSADHLAPVLFNLKKVVQLIYEKDYRFAQPPKMPTISATPGDGYVLVSWDNIADTRTREPLLNGQNDFEGYKVYRATDRKFSDPEIITDGEGTPMFKKPIFQCDLKNGKYGFTNYGLQNGMGVKLGDDTGITHSFIDNSVQNGRTYFYAVVAYDYGISPDSLKWKISKLANIKAEKFGIAPSENNVVIELDDAENVTFVGKNVAIVTPGPTAPGQTSAMDTTVAFNNAWGSGRVVPELMSATAAKDGHTYAVKFGVQRIDSVKSYPHSVRYSTNALYVYDVTDGNDILVYEDLLTRDLLADPKTPKFMPKNFHTLLTSSIDLVGTREIWHFKYPEEQVTDVFDGIRLKIQTEAPLARFSETKSGWVTGTGNSPITITPTRSESQRMPWTYHITFTGDTTSYQDRLRDLKNLIMRDENDVLVKQPDVLKAAFPFTVENMNFTDPLDPSKPEPMACIFNDLNKNRVYDPLEDRVFVGAIDENNRWAGTVFVFDFLNALEEELPQPGDVYRVDFDRPFFATDSLTFTIHTTKSADVAAIRGFMDAIKVVPNPYVATNVMETSVANRALNQRRRLMFTHIPEKCTIKIFTASGILVDEIRAPEDGLVLFPTTNKLTGVEETLGQVPNGVIHWDMLSKEGLEIAAGVYLFHVKNELTGEEKIGKFAVLK